MGNIVLVLNYGYEFLNIAPVRRALTLVLKGKAEVVETHAHRELISPSTRIKAPSIIRMLYYISHPRHVVPLTKKNILIRDGYTCQYCGKPGRTIDHVIPKSRGGNGSWNNCVCACSYCNSRKSNRTLKEAGMTLLKQPKQPKHFLWVMKKMQGHPAEWQKYLY